jgi:alkylation response protein AidB-like acyl-CoA dehydrogenase
MSIALFAPRDDPLGRARRLADQFAETAAQLDSTGAFPAANFAELHAEGITNLVTAREHGGAGASLDLAHKVVSEIARGEPSTALILSMHFVNHASIRQGERWPKDIAREVVSSGLSAPALVSARAISPTRCPGRFVRVATFPPFVPDPPDAIHG